MKKTIIHVVGARPNFMKIAPIFVAIENQNNINNTLSIDQFIVHTGQHYGKEMSESFFSDLVYQILILTLMLGQGVTHFKLQILCSLLKEYLMNYLLTL